MRDVVVASGLKVYWVGPLSGAKYALIASTEGIAYIRYLPGGVGINDTKALFRAVGTYNQKNAFLVAKDSAAFSGNTGFINPDGNSVFYVKTHPKNVYVGIKGEDIQLEIFDPVSGVAIEIAKSAGRVIPIN